MKKQILLLLLFAIPIYAFSPKPTEYAYVYCKNKYNRDYLEKKDHINRIINTIAWQETCNHSNLIGGSGELGAFQIMPATWRGWCKMYYNKILPMSQENQRMMIELVITDWVTKGLTIKQIAAKWNCGTHVGWENKIGINSYGVHYDVPAYVAHFVKQYNTIKKFTEINLHI